ncbi:unnamed protein product [Protopolystoma xenopodis]|uniref:Uncharacterized protein n=1 Tax=Protopolystoma xenopodis TaxID=117903 RepID=A0A448WSL8_9PLAT|nr:unnamed protein product [Protopolystoma xenopodis]
MRIFPILAKFTAPKITNAVNSSLNRSIEMELHSFLRKLERESVSPGHGYGLETLIGNWVEERHDLAYVTRPQPLTSEYSNNFCTSNQKDCDRSLNLKPNPAPNYPGRNYFAFPGHQPELDGDQTAHSSMITSYMAANAYWAKLMASHKDE